MAREVWSFPVTIPAGTLQATPQVTALSMPSRLVGELEVLVPPGPRGEVGFALGASGVAVLPQTPGQFIVTDNEVIRWPLSGQIDSGAWQFFAYNTGVYNHTLSVRFLVDPPGSDSLAADFVPIDTGTLIAGAVAALPPPAELPPPAVEPPPPPAPPGGANQSPPPPPTLGGWQPANPSPAPPGPPLTRGGANQSPAVVPTPR